jgi:hypothetical protein
MTSRLPVRLALPIALGLASAATGRAQQLIGYASTNDAVITGASDVLDGQAVLMGSVSITAKDHTAPITLGRGGTVSVCQTSVLRVTESRAVEVAAPLLFSLERGAVEILMTGRPNDAIMTPDLRFTVHNTAPIDLRLRVARNGDTCVENRGAAAPTLAVSDPFGESMYEVAPGQHILFEHGSVHEVVDRETTPCGCPESKGMSVADALLARNAGAKTNSKSAAPTPIDTPAEAHPFPAAVSEGLAPPEEVAPPPPGPHPPVTDALVYIAPGSVTKDPDALAADQPSTPPVATPPPAPAPAPSAEAASVAPAPLPPPPPAPPAPTQPAVAPEPPVHDLVHEVGRLFHKLFRRH